MAIIGKIRQRSGLIIIIIGIALAAFVLGDFIRKGPHSNKTNYVGIIDGEKISYTDFELKVEKQTEVYKQQTGKESPDAAQMLQIRQMTWTQILRETIMQKEYDENGILISTDELFDLVQGKNPHPYIVQNFTDPQTGQFNPATVVQFIKTIDQREPDVKQQWLRIEQAIKTDRLNQKYNNLISKSYYLPKALAEKELQMRSEMAVARVFSVNYTTIDDKLASINDDDYNKYYELHKQEYEQKESRGIQYVVFDVIPSTIDQEEIKNQVYKTYDDFLKENDVKSFVNAVSDTKYDSVFHKEKVLSPLLDSVMFRSVKGSFFGPYIENNIWKMAKLVDIQTRPDSIKASHILISYTGAGLQGTFKLTKEEAKAKADSIMAVLKKEPQKLVEFALTVSDFPQAKQDTGNLKWMGDGNANFALFFNNIIDLNVGDFKVVETGLGYHVLRVTGKLGSSKKVQVAVIERSIEPSNVTFKEMYTKANKFAAENPDEIKFNAAITKQGFNKRIAEYIQKSDASIPGVDAARDIVRWAYNTETIKGTVSLFDYAAEKKYVVALLTDIREKGIAPLEQVKKYIEPLVKRDKKASLIIDKVTLALKSSKDIYNIASKLNSKVDTLTNISFFSNNLPIYGPEPEVIGTIFSMKKNSLSNAIKGSNGIYVVSLDDIKKSPSMADINMLRMQLSQMFTSRVGSELYNALEENAKVEDNSLFFY